MLTSGGAKVFVAGAGWRGYAGLRPVMSAVTPLHQAPDSPNFGRGYAQLRAHIVEAGLLDRAYGYYAWRSSISLALLLGAIGLTVLLIAQPVLLIFNALLLALGSVQVALIGHDAGHLAIFRGARANRLAGYVCWSLLLGIGFAYWSDRHTRHHVNTNDLKTDPDLQWAGLVAYSEAAVRSRPRRHVWLLRYQAILGPLYTLGLAFAFRVEGWAFAVQRLRGPARVGEITCLSVSLVAWLLPTGMLGPAWLVAYALGQILAGLYLALVIAPNHKGMPIWPSGSEPSFLERQVLSSRNVTPSRLVDFLFGGLNYQIEHHLFPTMPRSHFSTARAIVRPFCDAQDLLYEELSVWASYGMVLRELRRVGRSASDLVAA